MQELQVHLKLVTPLLMKGVGLDPEIRIPSIRGALRYWYRALIGGLTGGDLEQVRKLEGEIFGQASGDGGQASTIILWKSSERTEIVNGEELNSNFPYFLFSLRPQKKKEKKEKKKQEEVRKGFQAGSSFTLHVGTRPKPKTTEMQTPLTHVWASLWLLTHLGNLGYRSRRGLGGAQVTKINTEQEPALYVTASDPKALEAEFEMALKALPNLVGYPEGWPELSSLPEFDILHPKFCFIWILEETFENWKEALNEMESFLRNFRKLNGVRDRNLVNAILQKQNLEYGKETVLPYLGLPIPYYFDGNKATLQAQNGQFKRRSSPLWIRVLELSSNKVSVVLTWFHSKFLANSVPLEVEIKVRGQPKITNIRQPNPHQSAVELREKLRALLKKEYGLLEVSYE